MGWEKFSGVGGEGKGPSKNNGGGPSLQPAIGGVALCPRWLACELVGWKVCVFDFPTDIRLFPFSFAAIGSCEIQMRISVRPSVRMHESVVVARVTQQSCGGGGGGGRRGANKAHAVSGLWRPPPPPPPNDNGNGENGANEVLSACRLPRPTRTL